MKELFWLMISKVSVHQSREGVVEQSISHHGSQETETKRVRTLSAFVLLPPFISFGSPFYWMVSPTFRVGLLG
jgi:hypothetical protein